MIKLICFIKRKPGLSRDDFREHWLHNHGPLIAGLPDFRRHVLRYEQNCRLDSDYERDQAGSAGFDGVTIQWFESRRDFYAFAGEHKDPRPVPIGLLLEHVLELDTAWAEERGVRLHEPPQNDLMVRADPDELQRALFNLVANAIDAMPDGGDLYVSVEKTGEDVVIELRDTGKGIDPAVAGQLFQPYFTTRSSGTGLGLAIVRRVIDDLGGRVELFNDPDGSGAIARVTLPSVDT